MNPRVKSVKPLCDYQLLLEFTNDEVGIYDCKYLLDFGVFKELQDVNYFKQVSIVGDTVTWINDQDICPDTLYLESEKMDEITAIWFNLMIDINNDDELCSSELALVFHFAWRLKMKYQTRIKKIDFEKTFANNKKLDLYVELDNKKIGFEIKFPKNSNNGTPDTGGRKKIINDIKRLCWLKENNKIERGYFLCATNSLPFVNKGNKPDLFETYQGSSYKKGNSFPEYEKSSVELEIIPYDFGFYWNDISHNGTKYILSSKNIKYAWLTPIII